MIKYFEFENEIEKVESILNQLNKNTEINLLKFRSMAKSASVSSWRKTSYFRLY